MDPRGIVAASTAASFSAPLVALHIGGANKLLAATFLVIVGTVAIYGLGAAPRPRLGLRQPEPEPQKTPAAQPPEPGYFGACTRLPCTMTGSWSFKHTSRASTVAPVLQAAKP